MALVALAWMVLGPVAWAADTAPGLLGVALADVTQADAARLKWDGPVGVRVVKPQAGSPAEKAGLLADDIIISIDGLEMQNLVALTAAIAVKGAGAEVKLRILRGGREQRLTVVLAARPAEPVVAATGPPELLPQLDTGGHMASIRGLTFTPDGTQIVSVGDDKAIRVWDWRTGKTGRTIRGELAAGSSGQIFAMALSPDSRTLAVGGIMAAGHGARDAAVGDIRLYDFATGKLTALLKGHDDVVNALAFSADGTRLISGSGDHTAIIWDVAQAKPLRRLRGHTDDIYAVGFSPDGTRAVTGSQDKGLRLWRVADGSLITRMIGHKDRVSALVVSQVDGQIASGSDDGEIRLWDGATGRFLRRLAKQPDLVGALKFSPDGTRLLSTTGYDCHVFDVATGRELVTYSGHDNIVLAVAISPDGRLAATGGGSTKEIQVWDLASGDRIKGADGQPLTLGGTGAPGWAVGFSTDGQRIGWGHSFDKKSQNDRGPVEFQFRLPLAAIPLGQPEPVTSAVIKAAATEWLRASSSGGGIKLAHRKGGDFGYDDAILDIARKGKTVASITRGISDGQAHNTYTLTSDSKEIISGGASRQLTAYDLAGKTLGEFVGHESDVWAVAISPDGRYLLSGSADQTVRLWNLRTYELIVTLFHGRDGSWVMYTPQGYFAGSPNAGDIIGWQINHGPDQAADYVRGGQLRAHFLRPDIVAKAIQLASASEAVKQSLHTNVTLAELLGKGVPKVRIVAPAANAQLADSNTNLQLAFEGPVAKLRVEVNGRRIVERLVGAGALEEGLIVPLPLAKGENRIKGVAISADGVESSTEDGNLTVTDTAGGALDHPGTVYTLAIGVDKYPALHNCCDDGKSSCDLHWAVADARAFAGVSRRFARPGDAVAPPIVLIGAPGFDPPNASNIRDALSAIQKKATENDTVVLFAAGHGVNDGPDYLFMPDDAKPQAEGGWAGSSVVPWTEFAKTLNGAKGRRLLFLDTCHAGNGYNQSAANGAFNDNITTFLATGPDQSSLEAGPPIGHGLFAYALIEGLNGKAAKPGACGIKASDLEAYLKDSTAKLVKDTFKNYKDPPPVPHVVTGKDATDDDLASAG